MPKPNKTQATEIRADDHIAALANEQQRADCQALVALMRQWTGHEPRMWGPSIVGFGSYHYTYDSGRQGDSCLAGFAARSKEIVIYLVASGPDEAELLARLGRHRKGQACLYIRRLAEIDTEVLARLVTSSVAEIQRRYGSAGSS